MTSIPPMVQSVLMIMMQTIQNQNEMIKSLAAKAEQVFDKVDRQLNQSKNKISDEDLTFPLSLRNFFTENSNTFQYELRLSTDFQNPVYKDRFFSVTLQVLNPHGEIAVLPNEEIFTMMLFTCENEPKRIEISNSGEALLKGQTEFLGNSLITFRRIVIKEVSSHFRNGCFSLVVTGKNPEIVRPVIVKEFVVKARKMNEDAQVLKKRKVWEEGDDFEGV